MPPTQGTATRAGVELAFKEGIEALNKGFLADAEQCFRHALAVEPNHLNAQLQLGQLLAKMLRVEEAEPLLRRVREARPDLAITHHAHGSVLSVLNRMDEAEAALGEASRLDPEWQLAQGDLSELKAARESVSGNVGGPVKRQDLKRWPILMNEFADLSAAARHFVLDNDQGQRFTVDDSSRFFTLGSCFAANLADSLKALGRPTTLFPYPEEINSTFANRYLLEWALGDLDDHELSAFFDGEFGGITSQQFSSSMAAADVVIFTVGVAPCFFDRETGRFVLPRASSVSLWAQDNLFRTTSVAENIENLFAIIESVRRINPTVHIVLTISPVPLKATLEMSSVIQADAISKSTLRVAVHEIMQREILGLSYWPSFEIVRWLGIYFEETFGGDDGRSRHVSGKVVDVIIRLFLEYYGNEPKQ